MYLLQKKYIENTCLLNRNKLRWNHSEGWSQWWVTIDGECIYIVVGCKIVNLQFLHYRNLWPMINLYKWYMYKYMKLETTSCAFKARKNSVHNLETNNGQTSWNGVEFKHHLYTHICWSTDPFSRIGLMRYI